MKKMPSHCTKIYSTLKKIHVVKIWKKGIDFSKPVCRLTLYTGTFPQDSQYNSFHPFELQIVLKWCFLTRRLLSVCCVAVTVTTLFPVTRRQENVSVRQDSPDHHVTASKTNTTVTTQSPTAPSKEPDLPVLVMSDFMGKIWAVLVRNETSRFACS
jgi:hypothetical protein